MNKMPVTRIQDKINDAKIKVDKLLYQADVFFVIKEMEEKDGAYTIYCYLSSPGNVKKFGILGFNEEKGKPEFAVEWLEMTKRNETEGVENPESYILLKNDKEFVDYFKGISLAKILNNRKK